MRVTPQGKGGTDTSGRVLRQGERLPMRPPTPNPLAAVLVAIGLLLASAAQGAGAAEVKLMNKLATASSPYLREAANQPVAWYPWGEEPFRLARTLDRPILLDIGAIWCHWCHVMDEQTYGNREVAAIINEHFVAIKVDRDERPDIDARYQKAVQALTGHGGWPLTVFMTPEGKVFHGGGTFLADDAFGRPGFKRLLPAVAAAYHQQKDKVFAQAERVSQALAAGDAAALRKAPLSPQVVDAVARGMTQAFDRVNGGFGQGVKFPMGSPIDLAFRLYAERGDAQMLSLATKTLDAMARGGMHDQIGGGFHRYATDSRWRVPHFEKMDYVNAQLLVNFLQAYQATKATKYRDVAEGIITYVNRELSDQQGGGFYAHQDADMGPGDDGGYYTWTREEVRAALPKEEARVLERYYDVDAVGVMPTEPGRNVLWVAATPQAIARDLSFPLPQVEALIRSGKKHLLEARRKRKVPFVDRTLFADRNAMMIEAYFEASKVLGRQELEAFALKTLEFLLTHLRTKEGTLYHAYADGKAQVPAFLSDYAWVAAALLDAFQVTGDRRYIAEARGLMDRALRMFWDVAGAGFFDLRPDPAAIGPLKDPSKVFEDRDVPSPNAVAALVLDRLTYLTNVPLYQQKAEQLLEAFAGRAPEIGRFAASYALAVDLHLHPPAHAVIIGPQSDPRTGALWRAALGAFRPGKIVAVYDPSQVRPADLPPPVAAAMRNTQAAGVPQAYICVGIQCSLPTSDPKEAATLVTTFEQQESQPPVPRVGKR